MFPPLLSPSLVKLTLLVFPSLSVLLIVIPPWFIITVSPVFGFVIVVPSPVIFTIFPVLGSVNSALVIPFNSLDNWTSSFPSAFVLTPILFLVNLSLSAPPTISNFSFNFLEIVVALLSPAKCRPSFIVARFSFTVTGLFVVGSRTGVPSGFVFVNSYVIRGFSFSSSSPLGPFSVVIETELPSLPLIPIEPSFPFNETPDFPSAPFTATVPFPSASLVIDTASGFPFSPFTVNPSFPIATAGLPSFPFTDIAPAPSASGFMLTASLPSAFWTVNAPSFPFLGFTVTLWRVISSFKL